MRNYVYPRPQRISYAAGTFRPAQRPVLFFEKGDTEDLFRVVSMFSDQLVSRTGIVCYPVADHLGRLSADIVFENASFDSREHYEIEIGDRITVRFCDPEGAFRATETLIQLFEINGTEIPKQKIEDWPSIERRGFMLDISRGKVPKLEKLFKTVDLLARLKMNEFQLYLETFAFEYSEFPEYSDKLDALTPFEILQLSNYAKERYVDLVPNQNSFGHLTNWLDQPELSKLRVSDHPGCASLNPIDPESLEFVDRLYSSLLPSFYSDFINVGCDEVGGLEGGKCAEEAKKYGALKVYMDFLTKINDIVKSHGKTTMFWGDILLSHENDPEVINRLPKDMIPLVWGYNGDDSFDRNAALMEKLGYKYYICPGTSSWIAMFPDLKNSNKNVLDGVDCAVRHHAGGVLMTEWGDFGHIQFDFAMQMGMIYAGAMSWNYEANKDFEAVCDFADDVVFMSRNVKVGELILKGAYAYDPNYFWAYVKDFKDNRDPKKDGTFCEEHYNQVKETMRSIEEEASRIESDAWDADLFKREIILSAQLYSFMSDFMLLRLEYDKNGSIEDRETKFKDFFDEYDRLQKGIKECWNARNKEKGNDRMFSFMDSAFENMKKEFSGKK
ncbi:MAG: family 20 glycosylhydrolase [Clostridia bacterium]|nr:family 20 glycosylhydrolase [Clostridia bacterium]